MVGHVQLQRMKSEKHGVASRHIMWAAASPASHMFHCLSTAVFGPRLQVGLDVGCMIEWVVVIASVWSPGAHV